MTQFLDFEMLLCLWLFLFYTYHSNHFLMQTVDELINMAHKYYDETALPKLVQLHFSMNFTLVKVSFLSLNFDPSFNFVLELYFVSNLFNASLSC